MSKPRTPATLEDVYLPLNELATYSGVSRSTLEDFLADPDHPLPHYRLAGKVIVVRRSEYDSWVQRYRIADPLDGVDALVEARIRGER